MFTCILVASRPAKFFHELNKMYVECAVLTAAAPGLINTREFLTRAVLKLYSPALVW
jgi:hypothetical protein